MALLEEYKMEEYKPESKKAQEHIK